MIQITRHVCTFSDLMMVYNYIIEFENICNTSACINCLPLALCLGMSCLVLLVTTIIFYVLWRRDHHKIKAQHPNVERISGNMSAVP